MSAPPQPISIGQERIVTDIEFYLTATSRRLADMTILSVSRALRTEETDSWYRPVLAELEGRCHEWVSSVREHTQKMMGGYAVHSDYYIFDSCPGASVHHECAVYA